jgi:hypothetical protein
LPRASIRRRSSPGWATRPSPKHGHVRASVQDADEQGRGAIDPTRYTLDDPVGIENTYARLSSVFKSYLADTARVERFGPIALEALDLYEFIRYSAVTLWKGRFRSTLIADRKKTTLFTFPFLLDSKGKPRTSDARLTEAAAIPCFAAFRALVDVPEAGPATWRYHFEDIKSMWHEYGAEVMREVHDAVTKQHNGNTHYAGRSVMLYRATTKNS